MEKKNTNTIIWVIVIAVLIIGVVMIFGKKTVAPVENPTDATISEPESTQDTTAGSATVSGSSMKYTDAVAKYVDRRIQLDKVCQAHPNNVTYKNGTTIMIDNRSPQAARVHLGSVFTINPYSFKIVTLSSTTFPKTFLVDCGTSQNVATILVQK